MCAVTHPSAPESVLPQARGGRPACPGVAWTRPCRDAPRHPQVTNSGLCCACLQAEEAAGSGRPALGHRGPCREPGPGQAPGRVQQPPPGPHLCPRLQELNRPRCPAGPRPSARPTGSPSATPTRLTPGNVRCRESPGLGAGSPGSVPAATVVPARPRTRPALPVLPASAEAVSPVHLQSRGCRGLRLGRGHADRQTFIELLTRAKSD